MSWILSLFLSVLDVQDEHLRRRIHAMAAERATLGNGAWNRAACNSGEQQHASGNRNTGDHGELPLETIIRRL